MTRRRHTCSPHPSPWVPSSPRTPRHRTSRYAPCMSLVRCHTVPPERCGVYERLLPTPPEITTLCSEFLLSFLHISDAKKETFALKRLQFLQ
jgi:hypothetical protein